MCCQWRLQRHLVLILSKNSLPPSQLCTYFCTEFSYTFCQSHGHSCHMCNKRGILLVTPHVPKSSLAPANRAMTLFTSLGPSADCRGLTQVPTYQVRIGHARGAAFSVSHCGFSLSLGLQGKVARTPHQMRGGEGTVCRTCLS